MVELRHGCRVRLLKRGKPTNIVGTIRALSGNHEPWGVDWEGHGFDCVTSWGQCVGGDEESVEVLNTGMENGNG